VVALATLGTGEARALACTITNLTGSYGTVNVLAGTATNVTATLTVTCSGGSANQAIRLCLNIGGGSTALGPSNERTMRTASDYVDHEFYSDAARTQVWGSWGIGAATVYPTASPAGVQSDVTLNASGAGTFNSTVFARVLANQQTKTPGSFSWTASSPTVQFVAKTGATNCPTNGGSSDAGGSSFTATISNNCNISTTALNFGSSSPTILANIDSTATITAQCTNTTPYSIGLNNGTHASGSQRRMLVSGTHFINYGLYTNSVRTAAWSTTSSTTSCTGGASTCALGTGIGSNQSITIFGRVPPQTAPASGIFTDTVVITATY
jgi:spore coat protein U-like protein